MKTKIKIKNQKPEEVKKRKEMTKHIKKMLGVDENSISNAINRGRW